MISAIRRAALLAAALAVPSAAQSTAEGLSVAGGARFQAAGLEALNGGFRPTLSAGMPRLDPAGAADFMSGARAASTVLAPAAIVDAPAAPALPVGPSAVLDLNSLLNRHLKTALRFQLSGATVWISGAFDRDHNPFVSILADGAAPVYFNVRGLLDADQHVVIGGVPYTLSLSANIFNKMHSRLNLKNDRDARELARFSIQDMVSAVEAAGADVLLSHQSYKFYYADGVTGERMFVFMYGNDHDFHVFLIPASQVPADRMGVFTLFNGKRVGLSSAGGQLTVYENP